MKPIENRPMPFDRAKAERESLVRHNFRRTFQHGTAHEAATPRLRASILRTALQLITQDIAGISRSELLGVSKWIDENPKCNCGDKGCKADVYQKQARDIIDHVMARGVYGHDERDPVEANTVAAGFGFGTAGFGFEAIRKEIDELIRREVSEEDEMVTFDTTGLNPAEVQRALREGIAIAKSRKLSEQAAATGSQAEGAE